MPRGLSHAHLGQIHHTTEYSTDQRQPHRRRRSRDAVAITLGSTSASCVASSSTVVGTGAEGAGAGTSPGQGSGAEELGAASGAAGWTGFGAEDEERSVNGEYTNGNGSSNGNGNGTAQGQDDGRNGNGEGLPDPTLVDSAESFWVELENLLTFPETRCQSLEQIDDGLRAFVRFCALHHGEFFDPSRHHWLSSAVLALACPHARIPALCTHSP
jgi:hypothetical protein